MLLENVKSVAELIRWCPGYKVNLDRDGYGVTLLHHACWGSENLAVIPLLLAHPDIDVNVKSNGGCTPFFYACWNGRLDCVREMLKDSRVKVNEPDSDGFTPLWYAARYGILDIIRWWIASGKEMDLGKPGDVDRTDAIGVAKKRGEAEVLTLLKRFKETPAETRHQVRMEIGWYNGFASEVFALVVFVSDGLLQIKDTMTTTPAARFFNIARRLPLELQMLLCFRQVGSAKEIVPGKESEVAFKELARKLL